MKRTLWRALVITALLSSLVTVLPVAANPPAPGDPTPPTSVKPLDPSKPMAAQLDPGKPNDWPNPDDYWRTQARQQLLEAGQTAEANALATTGTDRVLMILVDYGGTDVITWTVGDEWDPSGAIDPAKVVYDADGNIVWGDCSNIITRTTRFTYGPLLHNHIPRPLSASDPSGTTIWTKDFSHDWYNGFLFGNGVTINYTRTDGSLVNVDFTGKSLKNYYSDLSSGVYTVTGDVVGWVSVPHSTQWYGTDTCPGARSAGASGAYSDGGIPGAGNLLGLVTDALDAVNAVSTTVLGGTFNWANYDLNSDGIIDRLWIVHAGYGQEENGTLLGRTNYGDSAVWSHSGSIKPYTVTTGIVAQSYIMMPENGGIGVFAHEYAHNLGAKDLYTYGVGETSAGFWALQADDWTGYPIGFQPPAPDPMHLDNWGWLDPLVITDTSKVYTVTIGQASEFPGGSNVYRGAKIMLPGGNVPQAVPVWQGSYYWWGGKKDLANASMTTKSPITLTGGTTATLSFDLVYDLETTWDFLWVQVSDDMGTTWKTLTNTNTYCRHNASWIGELNGFPADLCGAGLGGFTGYNANWPAPELEQFNLTPFVGKHILVRLWYMTDWGTTYTGAFVDNVKVTVGGTAKFSDNAESGDANWTYVAPWGRSDGTQPFTHNFYLQWRNVGTNGGYDSALGDSRWRFGPANTGLLTWYNNNLYTDNSIANYLTDWPGFGPKGLMLVVDSHPDPYRDPYWLAQGYPNEGANVIDRSLMRDAPFTLMDTTDFTMTVGVHTTTHFAGLPATSGFHDSLGYYPGAEHVVRSPYQSARWITKQWDASTVVPATGFYGIKAPGYLANDSNFRFDCSIATSGPNEGLLLCYYLSDPDGNPLPLGYDGGTGNPGDYDAQYGWHAQLVEEDANHTWGTVVIWNDMKFVEVAKSVDAAEAYPGDTLQYTLVVTNHSPLAQTISLEDVIPDYLTYASGDTFPTTFVVAAGGTWTGSFNATVDMNTPVGTVIGNGATGEVEGQAFALESNAVETTIASPLEESVVTQQTPLPNNQVRATQPITYTTVFTNSDDRDMMLIFSVPVPTNVTYVDGSATGGLIPISGLSASEAAAWVAQKGLGALGEMQATADVTTLLWAGTIKAGTAKSDLGWQFQVKPGVLGGQVTVESQMLEVGYSSPRGTWSDVATIVPFTKVYLPIVLR
jgi:immune inhibitor A